MLIKNIQCVVELHLIYAKYHIPTTITTLLKIYDFCKKNIVHVNIFFHVNSNKIVIDDDGEIKQKFHIIAFFHKRQFTFESQQQQQRMNE